MYNHTLYCRDWRKTHKKNERESHNKWLDSIKHPCPICGVLVGGKAKACRKHKWQVRPRRVKTEAPNWKGGKTTNARGYVSLKIPEHYRARSNGYVYEHIVIWEQAHGQPLPEGLVIHHLNGITHDNRPNNLVALKSRSHSNILAAKSKRIQELEALLNGQGHLI